MKIKSTFSLLSGLLERIFANSSSGICLIQGEKKREKQDDEVS
jgi:uncharacterized protein YggU (UPF0235/DUF167 family)